MAFADTRRRSLVLYGLVYPAVVVAAALTLSDTAAELRRLFAVTGAVATVSLLVLLTVRGGFRPFREDLDAAAPDDPLPPPVRSVVVLAATAAVCWVGAALA